MALSDYSKNDRHYRSFKESAGLIVNNTLPLETTESYEVNANGAPVYIGKASPGTGKDEAGWQIQKVSYDGSGFTTDITWASGNSDWDKVWNDRASYSYA